MTHLTLNPGSIKGTFRVPPSKSQSLRALLLASCAKGDSAIHSLLRSPDVQGMIEACRLLGAELKSEGETVGVRGNGGAIPDAQRTINAGNSGLILRFCTAVAALSEGETTLTGDRSLCNRPMGPLTDALVECGAKVSFHEKAGYAPLTVRGPFKRAHCRVYGADSQPVSALLIASSLMGKEFDLVVDSPGELPWVELTIKWMKKLGVSMSHRDYRTFHIDGRGWEGFDYHVPGDWSSAAFLIGAAIVTGSEITLTHLSDQTQGDREILSILEQMGVHSSFRDDRLTIDSSGSLKGGVFDLNRCIDALPMMAVLGCFADGETRIVNAGVAKTKECDRIQCIAHELKKMGGRIEPAEDGLTIKKSALKGATLDSHGDHRIAMSLAVAALGAEGPSTVRDVQCIDKTFPGFKEALKALGARL